MLEPDTPTTIWIKQPTYPAFLLASDEGRPLKPSSIILRHRHLCQQQRISGIPPFENSGVRLMRRAVGEASVAETQHSESARSSPSGSSSMLSSPRAQGPSSSAVDAASEVIAPGPASVADGASQAAAAAGPSPVVETESVADGSPPSRASATDAVSLIPSRSQTVETTIGPLVVTHQERALRARGNKPHIRREKTTWYFSSSNKFLDAPPRLSDVSFGELYVHEGPDKQKQVWMWSQKSSWSSLQVAAPHPYLPDYILHFCSNGEPSWVTKETLRTYMGRMKKREADQQTPVSPQSFTVPQ